jgi:hypothetical protein
MKLDAETQATPSGSPVRRRRDLRTLVGLGVAATANALRMPVVPQAVAGVFFVPLVGIPLALVLFAAVGVVTSLSLRLCTGERRVVAGIVAAIIAFVAAVAIFAQTPQIPMNWIPWLGLDIGFAAVGPIAVAAAAITLPRWWIRLLGAALMVVAIGMIAGRQIIAAAEQRAAEDEQQRLATELAIENTLDTGLYPVTSAWDGARTVHLGPGGSTADAWLVTAEGGVIRIQTFADSPDTGRAELPCWLMHPVSGALDETVTMDDYMGVCELLAEGSWRLVDGSAVALTFEGHLVMVSGSNVTDFSDRGGERTAIPEEIAAAAAHLRTASREELREALVVVAAADR